MIERTRSLQAVRPPWREALVLVCQKCGGGKSLRRDLKARAKSLGKRRFRVVKSSCLDLCPKAATAVVVVDVDGQRGSACYVVPDATGAASLETLFG